MTRSVGNNYSGPSWAFSSRVGNKRDAEAHGPYCVLCGGCKVCVGRDPCYENDRSEHVFNAATGVEVGL